MKIGINGYEAVVPRFGFDKETGLPIRVGSAEVCFELLKEFEKRDKKNEYIVYLPVKPSEDMPKETENWKYKVVRGSRLWTLYALNKAASSDNLDVFFNPTHYSPLFLNCPQVITILDVSYKYFPELFNKKDLYKLSLWGKYSVKKASKVITISNSSKDDIIKEYGVPEAKIAVIPVGIKNIKREDMTKAEFFKKYDLDKPYILFVGTLQPRKNIARLIEAYSKMEGKDEYDLVIVGKKGWQYEDILSAPEKYGVAQNVKFLHTVSNEDLPSFYEHAVLFVLPSLYEGFGLPILEAMRYGCPVATSDVSSLPEAGGDAAEYFNPTKVEEITKTLTKIVKDKSLQEKMVKKGKEHIKKFSWDKSADDVLQVLTQVGGRA